MLSGATPLEPLDLLKLAVAKLDDGEARIQRVFEWQLERQALFLNLTFPVVFGALVGIVSPFFKGHNQLTALQAILLSLAILLSVGVTAVAMRIHAQLLYRRYVAAIELYGLLRQIVP
jgi:threonine/homoserine/homoserine lactone efflux protein